MTQEEYEYALGKLVILKLYLTEPYRLRVEELIEELEQGYLDAKREYKL